MSNIKLPSLSEFQEYAKTLAIRECKSDDGRFVGYKYTENTIFAANWDKVTPNARGIAFDVNTGKCVLRPYEKFFNYSELVTPEGNFTNLYHILEKTPGFAPAITKKFRYMDKLDGSLYIASVLDDGTFIGKTSGSFNAWQGKWAEQWLKEHVDLSYLGDGTAASGTMRCNCTFLFEIICNDDLHPISYDYEHCVLHGIKDNETGDELPLEDMLAFAAHWGLKTPEIVEFDTLADAIAYSTALPSNKEGGVITFDSGFKVKAKGKEFLTLQKLYHNLTPRYIWENFNSATGEFNNGTEELIPEEMPEVKEFAAQMKRDFREKLNTVVDNAAHLFSFGLPRKDVYFKVRDLYDDVNLVGATMTAYTAIEKDAAHDGVVHIPYINHYATAGCRESVKKAIKPTKDIIERE